MNILKNKMSNNIFSKLKLQDKILYSQEHIYFHIGISLNILISIMFFLTGFILFYCYNNYRPLLTILFLQICGWGFLIMSFLLVKKQRQLITKYFTIVPKN